MNRRGFTLVELLATLVILSIVVGITIVFMNNSFKEAKDKTENLFVKTLSDGISVYLDDSELKKSEFVDTGCYVNKTRGGRRVKLYGVNKTMEDVINSTYKPLSQSDLVNPSNEDVSCGLAKDIGLTIYRDEDFVYYYKIDRKMIGCLNNQEGYISNLPEEVLQCLAS